ncbi:hypothetical protein M8C21_031661, partial [Ambrosia artemisiifolia]
MKIQTFSERRLSLRSSKANCDKRGISGGEIGSCVDDCEENVEMGTKEAVISDDKGLFLGSEVLDPIEDLVVSCPKEESEEGEGNELVSIDLSETGLGCDEEIKSPHVDCENGVKSLESETFADDVTIVNGDDDKETSLNDAENINLSGECKEIKSSHVDCENGSKSLESETFADDTMIVDSNDKETSLDDSGNLTILGKCKETKEKSRRGRKKKNVMDLKRIESNQEKIDVVTGVNGDDKGTILNDAENPNILGICKEMKVKGRRGRKKKNVMDLKRIESDQEKIDVVSGVNGDDDECMRMPLKHKREKKRKNVEALGSECNGRVKGEKLEKDGVQVNGRVLRSSGGSVDGEFGDVVLGLKRSDDIPNKMLERLERPKVVTEGEGEDVRPKKKLKRRRRVCRLQGTTSGGNFTTADGEFRTVVLGLIRADDIPHMMLKRCVSHPKALTEGENTRPKKKLKKRGRPCKLQCDIKPLPSNEVPKKKLERRGRPRKVSHEIPAGRVKSRKGIAFKKFKHRPKMEAETLGEFLNVGNEIIGRKSYRRQLKQLIRDKISNILLKCGWTIDLKQRQEKSYMDAVYVEPNGNRSHWSITGAYATLKRKIETGNADNNEMSAFTPIPEEEISMLFRQRRKERKKKNSKILKNVKKGKSVTDKKKKRGKKLKDGSKRKMIFKPRLLAHGSENGSKQDNKGVLVIKKRNLLTWMIDSGVIMVGTKVQYGKTRRQKRSSEGIITSDGICCSCCSETMGITKFVAHCGGTFGQVFDNLYLESGVCLRKCLMDSWRKEEESDINRFNVVDIQGDDPNDDTCNICGDGGDLICCDGCPSTFHQSCLDVENFPSGDWNCIYCLCKYCGVVSISTPRAEDCHEEVTSQMLSCCLCEEK